MQAALSATATPPLAMGLRVRLSLMMLLQFAVWGAWFVVLGNYLEHLKLSKTQVGTMYSLMPLGAILSTMFVGQLADRYLASEKLMAILHIAGAGLLWWVAQIQDASQYPMMLVAMGLYALAYNPTLALANSIAFAHVPDGARDFPGIRVLGTIGWILVNLVVGQVLSTAERPAYHTNTPLLLGAALSLVLGIFSLTLPHTPPTGKPGEGMPFLKAFGLLRDRSFAVFFGVSFIITIVLSFYYSFTGQYLEQGQGVKDVASTMSLGQMTEMLLLPFLPWFLKRFGMKQVLALGMLAWGIRYAFFALGAPYALVLLGVALHGICFDFFFAAGFIHVDNTAPRDIRASGQALFGFLTYGAGMYLGALASGWIAQQFTNPVTNVTDWRGFWIVPCVGVLIAWAIFVFAFREKKPATA
jgi:nucleoside transporter